MKPSPMRAFDPRKVAYLEKEAWVAYYQKRWFRLLRLLIELVETTFGLSFFQALWAGYVPPRAYRLVRAWWQAHRAELRANWIRARRGEKLQQIEGLE